MSEALDRTAPRRFVGRHVWSVSLTLLSALMFWRLGREIADGELDAFDRAISGWFERSRGKFDLPMLVLTRVGAFWSMATICAVGALALLFRGKRWEAAYVLACGSGAALCCTALKLLFHRVRPEETSLYVLTLPHSFSFPSGHTMGTAGVIGSLVIVTFAMRPPRWLRLSVLVAGGALMLGVAASRVYFGVHFPSDIVGGQLGALAWVAAVTGWFFPRLLPNERALRP
jgi:undecaprenyl-diphosphatase